MAAVRILVDTDIFIEYFNSGRYARLLRARQTTVYYSAVTRKELLTKVGLTDAERRSIIEELRHFRLVPVTRAIAARYARVRSQAAEIEREDALIAATAIEKRLPLMTRNWRHFRRVEGLTLYAGG